MKRALVFLLVILIPLSVASTATKRIIFNLDLSYAQRSLGEAWAASTLEPLALVAYRAFATAVLSYNGIILSFLDPQLGTQCVTEINKMWF